MTHDSWFTALNQWHWILLFAMAYVLWQTVARYPLRAKEQSVARLNQVNFMVVTSFAILVFAGTVYVYDSANRQTSEALSELAFIMWTLTVSLTLLNSSSHKAIRTTAFVLVIGVIPLHYWYQPGVGGFLVKMDEFIDHDGGADTGLKLSLFLRWLFFFTHSYIILNYYGRMYEISYREKIKRGERKEGLQKEAINRAISVLAVAVSFFVALALIGTDLGKLSLFSGLVAAGVSIALRDLLANMAAGVLLLWDKSIKLNDVISLDKERYGVVRSMTMRYLVLEDRNDIRFLVPNSELTNRTITNWTQTTRNIRIKLNFGVGYETEIDKVKDIVSAICLRHNRVLQDPPPRLLILGLGDSTIDFQLRFFVSDPENGIRNVMGDLYEHLITRFREAKISMPFLQREIRLLPDSSVSVNINEGQTESPTSEEDKSARQRIFSWLRL